MTDKEFKRLSRSQLIEIIYQLQVKQEELAEDNARLQRELDDKRIRVSEAGNIAEASLEIHNVMQAAQDAALHYVEEVRIRTDKDRKRMLREAEQQAEEILAQAKHQAEERLSGSRKTDPGYDPVLEEILKEYQ